MLKYIVMIFIFFLTSPIVFASDKLVIDKIYNLSKSKDYYIGNCPCPYNTDQKGNLCGKRSAYCRNGGASPSCEARAKQMCK